MNKKEFAEQVLSWLDSGYAITGHDADGLVSAQILQASGRITIQINTAGIRNEWK